MPATAEPAALTLVDHPLVENALAVLRDVATGTEEFRRHARLLTSLLALHVLADLPTRAVTVQTPLERTAGRVVCRPVVLVPVLRAGLAMIDVMNDLVPGSTVGFVGLERDEETAIARRYYHKLPAQLADAEAIILDPMLATGGSALATIELLKQHGARAVRLACVVAAPEGLRVLHERHPDVRVFTAAVDRGLNERSFIVPGLGDFGDRYFGTV